MKCSTAIIAAQPGFVSAHDGLRPTDRGVVDHRVGGEHVVHEVDVVEAHGAHVPRQHLADQRVVSGVLGGVGSSHHAGRSTSTFS